MNIILGASGQLGSAIVKELRKSGNPVRGIVRDAQKAPGNTEIHVADIFNAEQLAKGLEGGTTVFLLTPENPGTDDVIGDTRRLLDSYKNAVEASGIKRIVGLSCVGAHIDGKTGNILMSRMLEEAFKNTNVDAIFIRPSYYCSNWLHYVEIAKDSGKLPTFFPEDQKLEMNSPLDVAAFAAKVIADDSQTKEQKIFELKGPAQYSSEDVAKMFSTILHKDITAESIPKEMWLETLTTAGFTENAARNMADMTQVVVDKSATFEFPEDAVTLPTKLEDYLRAQLG